MRDPVPAITEADATGETAAIFADIRHVLGVDVVNLIWRHLATMSGALPWAWGTLRPLYVDGTIAAEAARLHDDLDLPLLPAFPPEVLSAAGLRSDDMSAIRNVLAAYDRTNAMAIIALSALLSRLDDEPLALDAAPFHISATSHQPRPEIPLPPLLNLADLPPAAAELVMTLNRFGARQADPILASMYRHLAHWPPYLALAWTIIAPLDADGRLVGCMGNAATNARARAARVAARLQAASAVPPQSGIGTAIEPFTGDVLAKMVVICALLHAATGGS